MDYDQEQAEIVCRVYKILFNHSGRGWGKFQGDVVPRVIASYLGRHLSSKTKVVGPNVFIQDNPIEFDLMIVDSDAKPMELTSAYESEKVRGVIEVKRIGVISKREELEGTIKRIRDNLDSALFLRRWDKSKHAFEQEIRPNCRGAYISIGETINPARKGSIRYGDVTRRFLAPYPVFILSCLRSGQLQPGQWRGFVEIFCD